MQQEHARGRISEYNTNTAPKPDHSSSSSQSSLQDSSTVRMQPAEDRGLRGLHQVHQLEYWQYSRLFEAPIKLTAALDWHSKHLFEQSSRTFEVPGMDTVQENNALRDELTTSKSTILHLIHELNQAKSQHARSSLSHSSSWQQGQPF